MLDGDVFADADVHEPAGTEAVIATDGEHDGFVEEVELAVERRGMRIDLRFQRQAVPHATAQSRQAAPDDAALSVGQQVAFAEPGDASLAEHGPGIVEPALAGKNE